MSVQDKLFLSKTDCKEICYDINNDLVLIMKSLYTKALPIQSRNQIGSTWFKVTAHPLFKSSLYVNYEQIGLSGVYIHSEKLKFFHDPIWHWPLTYKLCSKSLHTIWQKGHCEWSLSHIGRRAEKIFSEQGFLTKFCNDLVQGHSTLLTQRHFVGELWARFGQGERRYAPDKKSRTDRRKDGRTDRLTTVGHPQSGALKMTIF